MTQCRRISDVLRIRAHGAPDHVAHDDTRRRLTYAEWDREADEVGGGLVAAGLRPGDRVFLPIDNQNAVEHAIAVVAVMRAGGIVVPVNVRLSPSEVAEYAQLTEPRFAIANVHSCLAGTTLEGVWSVDSMPRDVSALPDQSALDPDADAEILGTSGTTGKIKGVVVSHPDLMMGADLSETPKFFTSTLHAIPFSGSGGNLGVLMLPLKFWATTYTQPKFDAAGFLRLVEEKKPFTVYLVPTMLRLVLDSPEHEKTDFSAVKVLMTGTAPLPHDSVMRATKAWPHVSMRNSYGMSEGGIGVSTRTREQLLKPGCVGQIPDHMEVRSDDGTVAPPGVVGEIFGKQKNPRRYWRDDIATAANFPGGWTRTGDLGYVDEDGDLIVSGRSKELIIRGGYNITPLEIEHVLHEHPAVKDAAVMGVPHDVLGEDVAAAVSLRPGASATPDEIAAFCNERLANNKTPRTIVIFDSLPINANGKVVKRDLRTDVEAAAAARRKAQS